MIIGGWLKLGKGLGIRFEWCEGLDQVKLGLRFLNLGIYYSKYKDFEIIVNFVLGLKYFTFDLLEIKD